jgi:hypothetical protein
MLNFCMFVHLHLTKTCSSKQGKEDPNGGTALSYNGAMAFSIMTFSIMTFSIMTLIIMKPSIMTLSTTRISITMKRC